VLQRAREWLVLLLIGLLPFHAFLVTVGTRLLSGIAQAPIVGLVVWKEAVLGVVLLVAMCEIVKKRIVDSGKRFVSLRVDVLDGLILGMITLGAFVSLSSTRYLLPATFYGFKYTLFPLCLFLVLRRVSWSEEFQKRIVVILLVVGGVVAGYGILTFFLPQSFFVWLGYSDLHSLYIPDGPIAAFQQIGGTSLRRIQSTLSGPNQFGIWLLIPFSMATALMRGGQWGAPLPRGRGLRGGGYVFLLLLLLLALSLTFSRSAWIGAAVVVGVAFWVKRKCISTQLLSVLIVLTGVLVVLGGVIFPDVILRTASSRDHFARPIEASQILAQNPLGLGLGTAGPASNRVSDPCVFLEEGADASWVEAHPSLCVFVGKQQVQPEELCTCPLLPENWYLQVGIELGVAGMVLFAVLIVLLLKTLPTTHYLLPTLFGISITALFLHSWESSAVAYTVWVLLSTKIRPTHY